MKVIDITERLRRKAEPPKVISYIDVLKRDPDFNIRFEKLREAIRKANLLFEELKKSGEPK